MIKRLFDFVVSAILIAALSWLLFLIYILASLATSSTGLFLQTRVGRHGQIFTIYKFRTLHPTTGDINSFSNFLRRSKLDELPQLFNVLVGDMSMVGPRPDIPGYYDNLQGEDRKILELRPGITSLASIKYKNEEQLLAAQSDPHSYNDTVIFPDKVKMNLEYYYKRTFWGDLKILWWTIFGG
ncbi:MAG: sugar transferase [Flavobacterium sp.]|nr:sugar transferase [Flavobacterium sp.]